MEVRMSNVGLGKAALFGVRALLVHNENREGDAVARHLEVLGAEVMKACSSEGALAVLRAGASDVVVIDLASNDGDDLLEQIRAVGRAGGASFPVIALAADEPEARGRAFLAGFQARLSKIASVGHRAATEVEIVSGLVEGQKIVLHPPNDLADGAKCTVPQDAP
jgi:CheY-like chemotaxis protein